MAPGPYDRHSPDDRHDLDKGRKKRKFDEEPSEDSGQKYELDGIIFREAFRLPEAKQKRLRTDKVKPIEEATFEDIKSFNRNQLRGYCTVYGIKRKRKGEMETDLARYAALFHPNDPNYDVSKFEPTEYEGFPVPKRKVSKEDEDRASPDHRASLDGKSSKPEKPAPTDRRKSAPGTAATKKDAAGDAAAGTKKDDPKTTDFSGHFDGQFAAQQFETAPQQADPQNDQQRYDNHQSLEALGQHQITTTHFDQQQFEHYGLEAQQLETPAPEFDAHQQSEMHEDAQHLANMEQNANSTTGAAPAASPDNNTEREKAIASEMIKTTPDVDADAVANPVANYSGEEDAPEEVKELLNLQRHADFQTEDLENVVKADDAAASNYAVEEPAKDSV